MNIEQSIRDHTLKSLIDSGTKGHFPLFHPDWMENVYRSSANNVSRVEQRIAKKILLMLSKHRSLARKKTVLSALNETERTTFIRTFMSIVEKRILDKKPKLH